MDETSWTHSIVITYYKPEGGGTTFIYILFLSSVGGSYFLNIINNSIGAHGDTSHRKNKQLSIRQRKAKGKKANVSVLYVQEVFS